VQNQIKNTILLITTLIGLTFLLSSCNASKYLEEGQNFAGINRVILKSPERIEKKSTLKNELARLYKQKRNTNQMFVSFYYRTDDPSDTMWYDNFLRRFLAEEPSIFNEALVEATTREMEDFLRNKRGFYNAEVSYKLFNDGDGTIGVDYIVDCGRRYRINSIEYYCQDSTLQAIVDSTRKESFLIPGDPVSSREYELERNRISNLLQNEGYAQFYTNYIELTGDSADFKIDLKLNIYNPSDSTKHKKYYTGDVQVYTDFHPNQEAESTKSDTIDGVVLYRELPEYFVRPELISSMINLRPGDITKNQNRQETYNRLSLLSPYKFIAIKQEVDSVQQSLINYDIQLIPKPGIWYWNPGLELNYTTLSQRTQLFGLGLNFTLENENLFRGAERFEVNFNADSDIRFIQFKPQEFYLQNTYNLQFPKTTSLHKASLFYPVFRGILPSQYDRFTKFGSTKLSLGANYESLDNTISILALSASLGYEYRASEKEIIHINQIGVDYYSPTILNDTLFSGDFIQNSLSPRIITGLLFKDIAYAYNSETVFRNFTWQLLSSLEFSGHEIFLANKLFNSLTENDSYWALGSESLKFAKYLKGYLELRGQYKINQNNQFASRVFFGLGLPYGITMSFPTPNNSSWVVHRASGPGKKEVWVPEPITKTGKMRKTK
jgi:hypothetical protein